MIRLISQLFRILSTVIILTPFLGSAQTNGDYRSVATPVNWGLASSWQKYNGGWAAAPDYPGQNAGAGTVTIRDGHAITLNVSPANAIGALTVGGGASGSLTTDGTNRILTITNNLTITANGAYDLQRTALVVNGNTSISGSMTDGNSSGSAIFVGSYTVNNGGSFSTSNTSTFTFRGGITNNGTFNQWTAGAIIFNTNNQVIGGSQPITLNGVVTITGITVTNNNADLSLANTGNPSLTGTGTWLQGTGSVLKFSGTAMNCTVDFNTNSNTVNYTRAGTQTVLSTTYKSLTISTNGTKTLGGAITVNSNLSVTTTSTTTLACHIYQITGNASGTFTMASGTTLTLGNSGNATNVLFPTNFTNGNINLGTGTVIYQNSAAQTVSSTPTYGNLTIATGGTKTLNGSVTIGGNLSVSAGTFDLGTSATSVSIGGTAAITGTLNFSGTSTKSVTITGNLSGVGTINMSGGSLLHSLTLTGGSNAITTFTTAAVASTVTFNASVAQQVFASLNYRNIVISNNSIKTLQGATTIGGTLTINSSASLNPAGQNMTVSGSTTIAGTLADGTITGTNNLQDVDLSGGTINGAANGVVNINGNLTMPTGNGIIGRTTLAVSGTTTVASGRSLTINNNNGVKAFVGRVTINGTGTWISTGVTTANILGLQGGITNNNSAAGSFNAGTATFNVNNQNLAGSGPFDFAGAVIISGAITVTNQSSNLTGVTFNSTVTGSVAGSTWKNDVNSVVKYQPGVATQPMNIGVLDVSATGNTFNYSSTGSQNIKIPLTNYYNLVISGGGGFTKTLPVNTTLGGNLSVAASSILNLSTFNINVTGTTTIDGTLSDNSNTGTNTFTGLVTVSGTGTLSTANNSAFVFEGGITNNGTFDKTGTGAVFFNTNDQDISGTATITVAGTVTIAANKTVTYKNTNTSGIILSGVLDGANASSKWKNDVNSVVYYQPSVATPPMNTGILDISANGNTFVYNRAGDQNVKTPAGAFYNLAFTGTSGVKTLFADATVNGNLIIGTGVTLDVDITNNYDIAVKGNWVNSGGTFQARAATVTFNGTSNQQITSNGQSFYDLTIANQATQVTLNDDVTVTNICTLSDGVVSTGSNILILSSTNASHLAGFSNGSFVNGYLRRNIATNTSTYSFPLGNGTASSNYYRTDVINGSLTGTSYITGNFAALQNHDDADMDVTDAWISYNTVNTAGVWRLIPNMEPSGGSYDIRLYIENFSGLENNEFGPLKRPIGSTTAADWAHGDGSLSSLNGEGRLLAHGYMLRMGLTTFSEHGGGEGEASGGGLPIELLSFTASPENDAVKLLWLTATEINNDFFTIERSAEGVVFETLGILKGAGNSTQSKEYIFQDNDPLEGVSYYRLKQTDYDGTFTYTNIVSVSRSNEIAIDLHVYPNPVIGSTVFARLNGAIADNDVQIKVADLFGKTIYDKSFPISSSNTLKIELPLHLNAGLYLMKILSGNHSFGKHILLSE